VAAVKPGRTVRIEVYRDGKKKTIPVKVEAQPVDMPGAFGLGGRGEGAEAAPAFGLKVTTLTPELARENGYKETVKGVLITEVEGTSDAAEQGLRQGMVIARVQDKKVTTAAEFRKAISIKEAAKGVRLLVLDPRGGQRFVFITPSKSR